MDGIIEQGGSLDVTPIETPPVEPTPAPAPVAEPQDLAEAFAAIREQNKKPVEEPLGTGEASPTDTTGPGQAGPTEEQPRVQAVVPEQPAVPQVQAAASPAPVQAQPGATAGGSTTPATQPDYAAAKTSLIKSLQDQAIAHVNQQFEQQGLVPMSVGDLYTKDERSGEVRFMNPDTGKPFNSRAEAQAHVDTVNKQLTDFYKQNIRQVGRQLLQENDATIKLYDFAPELGKMDKVKRSIFDGIVAPYAVVKNNMVVGYNCDLNQALRQTDAVVNNMRQYYKAAEPTQSPVEASKPPVPSTGPAMDMKSGGGAQAGLDKEPADIQEAMKMYNEQKRAKK